MSEEKLRLCKSFEELRAGMLVVYRKCGTCGNGTHRGILLASNESPWLALMPKPPCVPPGYVEGIISSASVERRKVYIVETGNDDTAERNEGKLDVSIRDSRRVRYEEVKDGSR